MTDSLVGKQLNNFLIERLLGRGGMAQVFYGMDVGLNRPVAIKVIDERFRDDEPFTARFISEAQTIATWRHDNIIQVYYAGNEEDVYYFVMEFIDGEDLTDYINNFHVKEQEIPYSTTISILKSIASGLDYAHSKGVIHRDVKPSNIMISDDKRVVLMDFGLALDVQKGTIGESFGTPHYIAPEQAVDASKAVAQSDQYALGVIAFEMLTGEVPFDNPSAMNVALMHVSEPPPQPSTVNPNLTPAIDKVLLKALNKDPKQRFPSCQSFVETLEDAISGRPTLIDDVSPTQMGEILITPRPESNTETVPQQARSNRSAPTATSPHNRNRLPLTLGAVIIAVVIIIGALLALSGGSNNSVEEISPTTDSQVIAATTLTTEPSETSAPTDTPAPPTATIEPTETDIPSTATDVSTNTPIPASSTPLPTATTQPTDTPVPPTATIEPTEEIIAIPAEPTLAYPNGTPIVLYYNSNSFYIWNPTSERIRAGDFKFEALDSEGNVLTNAFDGFRWTQFYNFIDSGNCVAIEMTSGSLLKPNECGDYNSIVNATASSDIVFWTNRGNRTGFRVLWLDNEVARCDISESSCSFNIP